MGVKAQVRPVRKGSKRPSHTIFARGRAAIHAPSLAVYDGQSCIGAMKDGGRGSVVAYAVRNHHRIALGTFPDRTAAMRAIDKAVGRADG